MTAWRQAIELAIGEIVPRFIDFWSHLKVGFEKLDRFGILSAPGQSAAHVE